MYRVPKSKGVALRVFTDATGKYKAGPLYDDESYSVEALMDGFSFADDGNGHFRAQVTCTSCVCVCVYLSVCLCLCASLFHVSLLDQMLFTD